MIKYPEITPHCERSTFSAAVSLHFLSPTGRPAMSSLGHQPICKGNEAPRSRGQRTGDTHAARAVSHWLAPPPRRQGDFLLGLLQTGGATGQGCLSSSVCFEACALPGAGQRAGRVFGQGITSRSQLFADCQERFVRTAPHRWIFAALPTSYEFSRRS